MTQRKTAILIITAIVFQVCVLAGMLIKANLPLWTGQEIRVKVIPSDPRSLFRGNYVRLKYDFSRIPSRYPLHRKKLRKGEIVYISLRQDSNGLYELSRASLKRPSSGIFLRGRIRFHGSRTTLSGDTVNDLYSVRFGIEAFFTPKNKALQMEESLQKDGGVAILMVSSGGQAAIKDIIVK